MKRTIKKLIYNGYTRGLSLPIKSFKGLECFVRLSLFNVSNLSIKPTEGSAVDKLYLVATFLF